MATTITLATNRLQIIEDGVLLNSITYTNIDSINPLTTEVKQVSAAALMGTPVYSTILTAWKVEIVMRDGRRETITLGALSGDGAAWANTQAGFEIAENDIYAAFP